MGHTDCSSCDSHGGPFQIALGSTNSLCFFFAGPQRVNAEGTGAPPVDSSSMLS